MVKYHESVMVKEVLESLHIDTGSQIIDATLGTGGHTEAIIKAGAKVLGIEADPKILEIAKKRLNSSKASAKLVLGNFSDIDKIAKDNGFDPPADGVDGILFDLGVSNLHLKDDVRGFSFESPDQNLDMRLNPETQGVKASDLLNALNQTQLTQLFEKIMSHHESKRIAARVMAVRPINKVSELTITLEGIPHKEHLNPATLPMLALRIAVNCELDNLNEVIPKAIGLLKKKGKLLIITFHSAEEKVVQKYINERTKIRIPSYEEINKNIKARSAKLYVYTKD